MGTILALWNVNKTQKDFKKWQREAERKRERETDWNKRNDGIDIQLTDYRAVKSQSYSCIMNNLYGLHEIVKEES